MNNEAKLTWADGWPERIKHRVRELGFNTIWEFSKQNPHSSYSEMALMLGEHFAGAQLGFILAEDSVDHGYIDAFVKDSLYRDLYEQLRSKDLKANYRFLFAHGIAKWKSHFKEEYQERLQIVLDRMKSRLDELEAAQWIPASLDDPVIKEAFQDIRL